jgi:hypothetical protein
VLFVDAYVLLNSADLPENDLARADDQLQNFCDGFRTLFRETIILRIYLFIIKNAKLIIIFLQL